MKLLWLCNMAPGAVKEKIGGKAIGGLWMDHVLTGLLAREEITVRVLCPGKDGQSGQLEQGLSYKTFAGGPAHVARPDLVGVFREDLRDFAPDVIHVWGTEFPHTLAMAEAAREEGLSHRLVINIQGLCSFIARHYAEGLPHKIQTRNTFRDFVLRGEHEIKALRMTPHVIGRTQWDEAATAAIHPERVYHFCNETLRQSFYQGQWSYESCRPHRIFAAGCSYSVKGFHYMLEAFAQVLKTYPDATLAVPGHSFLADDWKSRLRRGSYQKYLAELVHSHGLEDKIEFLGSMDADRMKQAFLEATVFVLSSTIENSPNSLGEAMILGLPCVASHVGGVSSLMNHGTEGYLYQSTAPYMLAHYIEKIFAMGAEAASLGQSARTHAAHTHDPEKNLQDLLAVYTAIAQD